MLWKAVDNVHLLELGAEVSELGLTSESYWFLSPAVHWWLQRPSDSAAPSPSGAAKVWELLWAVYFFKKREGEKTLQCRLFQGSVRDGNQLLWPAAALAVGHLCMEGWWQRRCFALWWPLSCSSWGIPIPPKVDACLWKSVFMNRTLVKTLVITYITPLLQSSVRQTLLVFLK